MAPISLSSELEPGFRVHARLGHGPSTFVGHEFGFKEAQPQSAPRQPYLHEKIPNMGPLMLGRIKVTHQPIHSYLFFFLSFLLQGFLFTDIPGHANAIDLVARYGLLHVGDK